MKSKLLILLFFCTGCLIAQQIDYVDFKRAAVSLAFNPQESEVFGEVTYTLEIKKTIDTIFLDAKNMQFSKVVLNNRAADFIYDGKKLRVIHKFKRGETYQLMFKYEAKPKKALYFIDWKDLNNNKLSEERGCFTCVKRPQIWTQGQGKYTSNWLPSIDDMNDKIEFDLSISFQNGYEVIANGALKDKIINDTTTIWHYDMKAPMSSYLVALVIGKYKKHEAFSKSGIPLEMFYYTDDSLKVEPTYRYTKQIFDFLETEIGVSYPWQNYKQIPVKDFLYAGMENTTATIFSDAFVVNDTAFTDKNYVNVNAHELAHQWFGDLVTETSGTHHWLQEGFATYYALLAEREVFGDNYYYWRLYEYLQELDVQDKSGGSTSLLNPKSSSVTFYKKGAWVLHLLREKVGEKPFKRAVKYYLTKNAFKNVATNDFITEVEQASKQDLKKFREIWLESKDLNYNLMLESLKKSVFIQEYLMVDCELYSSKCNDYLNSGISNKAMVKVISQIPDQVQKDNFKSSLEVRQGIATSVTKIPESLKLEYESLLSDASYLTVEAALINLWRNFPEDREKYLNATKGMIGFHDKNIRILWLTLALITEDFEEGNKPGYFKELTDYTEPDCSFDVRQNAFMYLQQIKACNDQCKVNLKQGTQHHNWQFSKFSKSMLEAINNN
ncbi:M1 family metallopeptidase [Aestuariibaculum sediminum]|uniref:Aminopeptidase N n=1 Tax=Aestuariibaculum sediminum TaxID=2770637 RepID=A0A8J6UC95_9FLAO|nr:M1 family metallopeptidase [Aestuariibaculum sediminum]MBD0832139.1 M1 family metallopeptidase [Aestuariibaculum sediminum]